MTTHIVWRDEPPGTFAWFAPAEDEDRDHISDCYVEIQGGGIVIADGCETITIESKDDYLLVRKKMDECAKGLGWIE